MKITINRLAIEIIMYAKYMWSIQLSNKNNIYIIENVDNNKS